MSVAPLRCIELECELVGRSYARVPPGRYSLRFTYHETFLAFGDSPKLVLWFEIADPGEFFQVPVPKFYNVKALSTKPRRGGAFKAGRSSNVVLDLCALFPEEIARLDRLSLEPFKRYGVMGDIGTVHATSNQRELPAQLQYSVIRRLERLKP